MRGKKIKGVDMKLQTKVGGWGTLGLYCHPSMGVAAVIRSLSEGVSSSTSSSHRTVIGALAALLIHFNHVLMLSLYSPSDSLLCSCCSRPHFPPPSAPTPSRSIPVIECTMELGVGASLVVVPILVRRVQ
ncbi:hypothetical protein GQ43DRAFT_148829 [Delitschia confertaspora ATCC 74209]|uniref:Uncharacterized protein n=1 Tax=Delitschia confertaspora ATCC 74209 TaxID=1513339 RepID=A0A9P4JFY0_9PLEO|nr:hypothetical protein GQ43DRAFT_148829 [Delitschia confertaspora ATCC 74209]